MYKFILMFSLAVFCQFVFAAATPDLDVALVPVANQSSAVLAKALPNALSMALVKISGHSDVAQVPAIKSILANAKQWVTSYSYQTQTDEKGNTQYWLRVNFNHNGLVQLLQAQNQPVWGDNRPLTLVCLRIQGSKSYVLSSNDNNNPIALNLKNDTFARGISYLLPVMDLEDQDKINLRDSEAFNTNQLQEISKRYGVETVLSGNLETGMGNIWQAQWLLLLNGEPYQWNNSAANISDLVTQAINKMVDMMANQWAVAANSQSNQTIKMAVTGIDNLDDYVNVMKYLRSLSPISRVDVDQMDNSILLLDVNTVGGEQQLVDALHNSDLLVAENSQNQPSASADVYYQWKGHENDTAAPAAPSAVNTAANSAPTDNVVTANNNSPAVQNTITDNSSATSAPTQ